MKRYTSCPASPSHEPPEKQGVPSVIGDNNNQLLEHPGEAVWPVIVIGGGIAGLTTAAVLASRGIEVLLLEGRAEVHGRTLTHVFPSTDSLPLVAVDLGANYIHGASKYQPLWGLATKLGVQAPLANSAFWMDTKTALWFDARTAEPVLIENVARLHILNIQIWLTIDSVPRQVLEQFNLLEVYTAAKSIVLQLIGWNLTDRDEGILDAIRIKERGYVSAFEEMSALDSDEPGMEYDCTQREACGSLLREALAIAAEDVPKIAHPESIDASVSRWLKGHKDMLRMSEASTPPKWEEEVKMAISEDRPVDRLCVDGYHWLVQYMKNRIPQKSIRTNSSVEAVDLTSSGTVEVRVRCPQGLPAHERYCAYQVVVAVPLGVLKNQHRESSIAFTPPLGKKVSAAIDKCGMGTHNKIILRFDPSKKFWPDVGNFASSDSRFQWLNLDYYGKVGTLCTHIYPPFAYDMLRLTDDEVIAQVLATLRGMFRKEVPDPEQVLVKRWNTDPFALGSYSFTPKGASDELREVFSLPQPSKKDARIFFAGEHTVVNNQCVLSAYESALRVANHLLVKHFGSEVADEDQFPGSFDHDDKSF